MSNVHYMTLAAIRAQNPTKFDEDFKAAWAGAFSDVGQEIVIKAVSNNRNAEKEILAA